MKRFIQTIFISLFLLLISPYCFADRVVKVALGDSLPPWVIQDTNNGIIFDILKATLEPEGYIVEPVYVPYARRLIAYEQMDVDIVCDINQSIVDEYELGGFLSQIIYAYENVAISLKERNYKITSISDLINLSVLGWQGSSEIMGDEYARMTRLNPQYNEIARQKTQVKMLLWGRVDVIQMDRLIFEFYRNEIFTEEGEKNLKPVEIVPLFGLNEVGFLFWDEMIKNIFDKNWNTLVHKGEVGEIYDKYLSR